MSCNICETCKTCDRPKHDCDCPAPVSGSSAEMPSVVDFDESVADRLADREFALAYIREAGAMLREAEATAENWRENAMGFERRCKELEAALEKTEDAFGDWIRDTEEECSHLPEWKAASEAVGVIRAGLKGAPGQGAGGK